MNRLDEILNKLCLICGKANRFHKVFWSPHFGCYTRQTIEDVWIDHVHIEFVPSNDHYACIDNLEYLEYLEHKTTHGTVTQ